MVNRKHDQRNYHRVIQALIAIGVHGKSTTGTNEHSLQGRPPSVDHLHGADGGVVQGEAAGVEPPRAQERRAPLRDVDAGEQAPPDRARRDGLHEARDQVIRPHIVPFRGDGAGGDDEEPMRRWIWMARAEGSTASQSKSLWRWAIGDWRSRALQDAPQGSQGHFLVPGGPAKRSRRQQQKASQDQEGTCFRTTHTPHPLQPSTTERTTTRRAARQ